MFLVVFLFSKFIHECEKRSNINSGSVHGLTPFNPLPHNPMKTLRETSYKNNMAERENAVIL